MKIPHHASSVSRDKKHSSSNFTSSPNKRSTPNNQQSSQPRHPYQINSPHPHYHAPHFQSINEFHIIEQKRLGNGSFGVVKLGLHMATNRYYAIKIIEFKDIPTEHQSKLIEREIKLHSLVSHPHIVKLWDTMVDEKNLYMVLEYAQRGNLFYYQNTKNKFTQPEAFMYFIQTVKAIEHLHLSNIVHRDIKPQNLLLDRDFNIKLCDFGWSAENIHQKRKTFCGTYEYMAPEMIFDREEYDYRIDIWALGVLLYEMIHGYAPFKGKSVNEVKQKMLQSTYHLNESLSDNLRDLIVGLLKFDPNQRLSIKEVLNHSWVQRMEIIVSDYVVSNESKLRKSGGVSGDTAFKPENIHSLVCEVPVEMYSKTDSYSSGIYSHNYDMDIEGGHYGGSSGANMGGVSGQQDGEKKIIRGRDKDMESEYLNRDGTKNRSSPLKNPYQQTHSNQSNGNGNGNISINFSINNYSYLQQQQQQKGKNPNSNNNQKKNPHSHHHRVNDEQSSHHHHNKSTSSSVNSHSTKRHNYNSPKLVKNVLDLKRKKDSSSPRNNNKHTNAYETTNTHSSKRCKTNVSFEENSITNNSGIYGVTGRSFYQQPQTNVTVSNTTATSNQGVSNAAKIKKSKSNADLGNNVGQMMMTMGEKKEEKKLSNHKSKIKSKGSGGGDTTNPTTNQNESNSSLLLHGEKSSSSILSQKGRQIAGKAISANANSSPEGRQQQHSKPSSHLMQKIAMNLKKHAIKEKGHNNLNQPSQQSGNKNFTPTKALQEQHHNEDNERIKIRNPSNEHEYEFSPRHYSRVMRKLKSNQKRDKSSRNGTMTTTFVNMSEFS